MPSARKDWVALHLIPGMGARSFLCLLQRFGSPAAALAATSDEIRSTPFLLPKVAASLMKHRASAISAAERELADAAQAGIRTLTLWDPEYPPRLRQLYDPPPVLHVRGTLDARDDHSVALVGTRRPSEYGRAVTEKFAADLARLRFTIVSGLARGVDGVAHSAALKAKGRTIAVLGSGLLRVYPPEHRSLAERIAENGAVVSEFPLRADPLQYHFPIRNRVVAALSLGVVVIEGSETSGALITADAAAEQGRDVFAVPGNILRPSSRGPHRLLRAGATLVEDVRDILEKLGYVAAKGAVAARTADERPPIDETVLLDESERGVFAALGDEAVHVDEIAKACSLPIGRLHALLTGMELKGLARQEPGGRFARIRAREAA